ncbi:MAG: right-handed parallel beta-helix repeat-containing protein [Deltaproteobacteria bacterium]|nr:right-handed parallel beta-helix repeat-containing protein [Deltaproteobacteria bacterium]
MSQRMPGVLFVVLFSLLTSQTFAATRSVSTSGINAGDCLSTPCRSIQYAIDHAAPGDTVAIAPGLYTETLLITSAVTLLGTDTEQVVVQARGLGPQDGTHVMTIDVPDGTVTIEGMTIRHGDVGIIGTGNISVRNAIFYHNGYDGAPYPSGLSQEDVALFYAAHATNGGAIQIAGGAGGELSDNLIYENDGAIQVTDTDAIHIHDNILRDNIGSGIDVGSSTNDGTKGNTEAVIERNTVLDHFDHGIRVVGGKAVTIAHNTIEGNWSAGILLRHPAQVTVTNNACDQNNLSAFTGRGVLGDAWGTLATEGSAGAKPASFAVKLMDNIFAGSGKGRNVSMTAVHLAADLPTVELRGNLFLGYEEAVVVTAQADTTSLHYNDFVGGKIAVRNDDLEGSVSAERNWWGCAGGSGTSGCDGVVGSAEMSAPLQTPYPAKVKLQPTTVHLDIDADQQYAVTGTLLNGNIVDVTPECLLESLDPTIAALTAQTVVTGVADGATALLASCFDGAQVAVGSLTVGNVLQGTVSAAGSSDIESPTDGANPATATSASGFDFGGAGFCAVLPWHVRSRRF